MTKDKIVIIVNKTKVKRYIRIFENDSVKIALFDEGNISEWSEKASIVLLCIESFADMVRYLRMQDKFDNSRIVVIVGNKIIFANFLSKFINAGAIRSKQTGILFIMECILDALTRPGLLEINVSDFLQIHKYGEVWFESCTGMKEIMLYRMVREREMRKNYRCCLVNVTGDITLQDASDFCSIMLLCEDARMGFRYEEDEEIRVFSLWRVRR